MQEVERQSRFGLTALEDMQASLAPLDADRFWYSTQAFLIAVANVSKLLWPSKGGHLAERTELRQVLLVREESPLKTRTLRNDFEHFDERLETWAASSERKNLADCNIGPPGMIRGIDYGDFLRNFDTINGVITFQGHRLEVAPVERALRDLAATAAQVKVVRKPL